MRYFCRAIDETILPHFFLFISDLYHSCPLQHIKQYINRGCVFLELLAWLQRDMIYLNLLTFIKFPNINPVRIRRSIPR